MYELPTVEHFVNDLNARLEAKGVSAVQEIRLRKGEIFSEDELKKAFTKVTPETTLDGTNLVIEEDAVIHYCSECGYTHTVSEKDLLGHLYICPECASAMYYDESEDLELVEIKCD